MANEFRLGDTVTVRKPELFIECLNGALDWRGSIFGPQYIEPREKITLLTQEMVEHANAGNFERLLHDN